jgi:hypothetical protein
MLTWFVNYKDGTRHDYVSKTFNIGHIDKDKIDTLVIHNPNDSAPVLVIHFDDPRKRPIYVRRNELPGRYNFKTVCHIVGWQMKVGHENIQSICYVFETQGRIIKVKGIPTREEKIWIENAGPFNRERNPWFKDPGEIQRKILGSRL